MKKKNDISLEIGSTTIQEAVQNWTRYEQNTDKVPEYFLTYSSKKIRRIFNLHRLPGEKVCSLNIQWSLSNYHHHRICDTFSARKHTFICH